MFRSIQTFLLCIAGMQFATAQTLEIVDEDPQGLYVSGIVYNSWPGHIEWYCNIVNHGNDTVHLIVGREFLQLQPGHLGTLYFGPWGYPYFIDTIPEEHAISLAPGDTTDFSGYQHFHGTVDPNGIPGLTVVRYCFFDTADISNAVCADVTYEAIPEIIGVDELESSIVLGEPYPNPANEVIKFEFEVNGTGNQNQIQVFNTIGEVVHSETLSGRQGVYPLNTSTYPAGIYHIVIQCNDNVMTTKKFTITR